MKLFRRLVKPSARKFVGRNIAWLLAISSLLLVHTPAAAEDRTTAELKSEHWIDRQVRKGKYKLSASEEEGLYFCSVRNGKVLEVELERGFVTVIFHSDAPRFFRQSEISQEMLVKLASVTTNQTLDLLCVHSFYRDDWQARYDKRSHKELYFQPGGLVRFGGFTMMAHQLGELVFLAGETVVVFDMSFDNDRAATDVPSAVNVSARTK